jgi:hypothetical protein
VAMGLTIPASKLSLKLKILLFHDSHGSTAVFIATDAHPVKNNDEIAMIFIIYALIAIFFEAFNIEIYP